MLYQIGLNTDHSLNVREANLSYRLGLAVSLDSVIFITHAGLIGVKKLRRLGIRPPIQFLKYQAILQQSLSRALSKNIPALDLIQGIEKVSANQRNPKHVDHSSQTDLLATLIKPIILPVLRPHLNQTVPLHYLEVVLTYDVPAIQALNRPLDHYPMLTKSKKIRRLFFHSLMPG